MTFGMLLLVLVVACAFAGSMIVQQREPMEYVNRYGAQAAQLILALGLDDVFSAPYFLALMAALCLNLTLCSIVRLPKTMRAAGGLISRAQTAACDQPLEAGQAQKLISFFQNRHYRRVNSGEKTVFTKGLFGFYGSFFTHLSFLLILVVGAAAIAFGADLLVDNGTLIAQALGVPESVIALTFVALGTSLPELVTAITSLAKGHGSLSLGNIIGANLFNLVLVSGLSVTLSPFAVPASKMVAGMNASLVVDIPLMFCAMAFLTLPGIIRGKLQRWQGVTLLCIYAAYIGFQFFG